VRARLRNLPPLNVNGLWSAQIEAIENLERSLAQDRPRALIQMATGSGKTFTAVSFIYRLIKFAGAKRVLFLVDRSNLGRQTLKEFQQYVTPDDGRKFTELYNVQHLQSNTLDAVSRVCITTIQRLYSMLSGEAEFDPELEEGSLFDADARDRLGDQPKDVRYNAALPIEYFDFIVTDECHRSIYHLWRQVLEYFDGFITGLTATPSKQTFGFFNQNLVMEYSRQRAVADGVNVDGQVYRIRTQITEAGSTVEAVTTSISATDRHARCAGSRWTKTWPTTPRNSIGRWWPTIKSAPSSAPIAIACLRSCFRGGRSCPRRWSLPKTTATRKTSCALCARSLARAMSSARRSRIARQA
jgi:type I restriction enzyme R subunit